MLQGILRENEVPFLLPGILSRGENFLALGFDEDCVEEYDGIGHGAFDARAIAYETAVMVKSALEAGLPALLVGASLGGMLIPFVYGELCQLMREVPLDLLRCLIIDAPFGAETMIAMGCSAFAGRVIRSPIGQALRPLASIKVGPKDQHIEVPDDDMMREIAGIAMSGAEWRAYVKRRAIAELSDHSSKQWLEQLRWMTQMSHDGSLHCACLAMRGVDTSYLACVGPGNDVVKQPLASELWAASTPDLKMYSANAVHCGFVQQAPTFRGALAEILG